MRVKNLDDARKLGRHGADMIVEAMAEADETPAKKPSKYGNQRCVDHRGRRFDSKLERENHLALERLHFSVLRQVSFPVDDAGETRMRVDHLVIHEVMDDGRFVGEFADSKGVVTNAWDTKRIHFRDKYGVDITVLGKGDV